MTHLNDKFTAYAPLINSFAQIASSSNNPQLLAQITSLLTTLKNQISATRAADAGWEDRKAAAWAKELADLQRKHAEALAKNVEDEKEGAALAQMNVRTARSAELQAKKDRWVERDAAQFARHEADYAEAERLETARYLNQKEFGQRIADW